VKSEQYGVFFVSGDSHTSAASAPEVVMPTSIIPSPPPYLGDNTVCPHPGPPPYTLGSGNCFLNYKVDFAYNNPDKSGGSFIKLNTINK